MPKANKTKLLVMTPQEHAAFVAVCSERGYTSFTEYVRDLMHADAERIGMAVPEQDRTLPRGKYSRNTDE
jgi:hypothetical protein